jgi:hypothetical protein
MTHSQPLLLGKRRVLAALALLAGMVARSEPAGAVDLPVQSLSLVDTASVQRPLELQTRSLVS